MKASKQKKILFIESGTLGGGSFESLTQHVKVLDQAQYLPIIVCFNKTKYLETWAELGIKTLLITNRVYSRHDNRWLSKLAKQSFSRLLRILPFLSLPIVKLYFAEVVKEIEKVIVDEDISLIHLNDNIGRDAFGAILSQNTGIPCISHLRSINTRGMGRGLVSFCNRHIHSYIANSEMTKSRWSFLGIDAQKTEVIYNGISLKQPVPTNLREQFSIASSYKYVIGCVANLYEAKGHSFLLDAFKKLPHGEFCLVLVGHGYLEDSLKDQARKLGILDHVRFVGFQSKALAIISSLDVLVVPSKMEAFGRTILEAMMVDVPVVGSHVGGIPEVIQNQKTGLTVSYGDTEALAGAITSLVNDNSLRNTLVDNAKQRLLTTFTIDKYALRVAQVYDHILGINADDSP